MAGRTSIEWATDTWNPVTGCDQVSPGCDHCYAKTFAERWRGTPGHAYEQGFDLRLWPTRLDVPLHWRKPRRVFVNSMSDLFHADIPTDFIGSVFDVMLRASWHQFLVLTKRPQRMRRFMRDRYPQAGASLPNVWLGTSIESDDYTWRANMLRQTPAATRFLSCEPLLGPLPSLNLDGIHWVIAGAESGHGARPMDDDWVRDLRDRSQTAGAAFFFKQRARNGHKEPLPMLDGRQWMDYPEVSA